LKGWSEEDRGKEWNEGSTEHRELITDGNEETLLVPNAAGLFVVQSAAELAPPPTNLELALERLLKWVHSVENIAIELMGVHSEGGMLRFRHVNLLSDSIRREIHGGEIGEEFKGRIAFEIQGDDGDGSKEEGNVEVRSKLLGVWGRSGVHWDNIEELLPVLPARHDETVVIRILGDNGTLLGSCKCDVLDLTITPMSEVSLKFVEAERTLSEEEAEKVQKDRCVPAFPSPSLPSMSLSLPMPTPMITMKILPRCICIHVPSVPEFICKQMPNSQEVMCTCVSTPQPHVSN
jgi:hypothetical protein